MPRLEHTRGLVAAPHTPFRDDGGVDFDAIPAQVAALASQGLAGVFICGTTGEGFSMTSAERRRVLESWIELAPSDLRVFAHVGHHSVEEARLLARHAAEAGAWGTALVGPSFVKPGNAAELAAFCQPVAAAAPELPFYYYHIPSLSGVQVRMIDFLAAAGQRIPNLAGIKFTHSDLMDYQQCLAVDGGRYDILWGTDEALLGALAVGAVGAVGSTYNYAAPVYHKLIAAFQAGDLATARRHSGQAVALVEVLLRFGVLAAGKALMDLRGAPLGPTRPPVTPLTAKARAALFAAVADLGVIESPSTSPPTPAALAPSAR